MCPKSNNNGEIDFDLTSMFGTCHTLFFNLTVCVSQSFIITFVSSLVVNQWDVPFSDSYRPKKRIPVKPNLVRPKFGLGSMRNPHTNEKKKDRMTPAFAKACNISMQS